MQHIKRVRVTDFQSLAAIDLELGPLTVIVGHTGSGKSSIVRALQAALFNWSGGSFVRDGADKAIVEIEFSEAGPAGNRMRWIKPRKGGARYFVEHVGPDGDGDVRTATVHPGETVTSGVEISRVGKEMPPQISELTGIREIECEGAKAVLQVSSQFDPPFLLMGTGGQAARLLAKVARTDVITTAQVRARKDLQARRQAADKASEAVSSTLAQLTAMPDYEAKLVAFEALQERLQTVTERANVVGECEADAQRLATARANVKEIPPALAVRVKAVSKAAEGLGEKARLVTEAIVARRAVEAARESVTEAQRLAAGREKALADALSELKVCPICNRVMEKGETK